MECCENISEEDEKDFLQTWDEGTGENDSDIMLTSFSGTGWQSCGTMTSERSYMSSVVVNNNIYTFGGSERGAVTIQLVKHGQQRKRCRLADINIWL